ncbi:MAG: phenylacetate--CoA ligase family protein, partial [Casimicrobiaceae bacterium]
QDHGSLSDVVTSGSTGVPVKVRRTELTALLWEAITLRDHAWHQRDFDATLAGVRWYPDDVAAYPHGASWPDWGPPAAEICSTAPSFGLSVTASASEQAEWLSRIQPEYLVVFPSLLPQLARECVAQDVRLDRLRQIHTVGECLPAGLRALCARQWGVPVRDTYSAHEVGYIALQCPLHDHYHAQSECILVEVLDAQGRACEAGEIGRVVVTPLHNYAIPLLRYALGDYAEAGAPCACGRGLRVLSRVLGRSRNMLTLPDGRRVWPRLSELEYGDVLPVTQFQVIQKDATRLEVRLVAERAGTPEEERRLRATIVERIGYPFEVVFSYPDHIARGAGGKFEDFRSEVSAA